MNTILAGIISLFLMQTPQVTAVPTAVVLGQEDYSLENRYSNTFVNDVFADNILLTLAYMRGEVRKGERIIWEKVRAPFTYSLTLDPGQTFAFHERVLPEFKDKIAATTNAHFNSGEGFRSDGRLVGDGVCHLASFMNVVAREAKLEVVSPTRHDFAKIEDVAKEMGVSIFYNPNGVGNSARQNLYITNNREERIAFVFEYKNKTLDIQVKDIVD